MCNEERRHNEHNESCIHELLKKICLLQKQEFLQDEFKGCDKPFLGPTPTRDCFNTRPVQLFNCNTGNLWDFPIGERIHHENAEDVKCNSTIFRIESIDDNCATFRILERTSHHHYRDTDEFFTINMRCIGAVKCLPDAFVELRCN